MQDLSEIRNIYIKKKGGTFDFKGNSMEPTLKEGCRVIVEPVRSQDIKPGDIIVFGKRLLACHRVVGRLRFKRNGKIYFLEKGDSSNRITMISEDEIIGKVAGDYVFKKNRLMYLLDFFIFPYVIATTLMKTMRKRP